MATDIMVQISDATGIPTQGMNVGNSAADHQNPPPFDYLKIFITIAVVCICTVPGLAIFASLTANGVLSLSSFTAMLLLEYPYILMIILCFPRHWGIRKQVPRSSEGIAGIYYKSRMNPSVIGRLFMASSRLLARTGLLISWGLAVIFFVPKFSLVKLHGSPLWIWILLFFTIPAAYFAAMSLCLIGLLIKNIITMICKKRGNRYPYRLFGNTVLVYYFGILLGVWVGYFRTEIGLKNSSDHVTWICISLFVGSILWFLKACTMMMWSAKAIYRRFEPRILMTTVKFLYLGLIAGDFFIVSIIREIELVEEYVLHSASPNYSFQKYIMSKHVDTTHLNVVSQYLTSLSKIVEPLQDQGLSKLLDYLTEKITATCDTCHTVDLVNLMDCWGLSDQILERLARSNWNTPRLPLLIFLNWLFRKIFKNPTACNLQTEGNRDIPVNPHGFSPEEYRNNLATVLHLIVLEQCPSDAENQFTFDDLKRWMVDAHLNCVNMGRTLEDASTIVTRLDMIISIIISTIVVVMWLLISGIATTKVLVTIGTPLLALTFIFGDSAKMFFQGIIFCFCTHSFDVGDRCILDDTELEVERISILTTKIIKIGTEERRIYPNAVLATKAIINKGWEPDPSDTVELKLDMSMFRKQWEAIESKLERFFKDDQQKGVFQSWHEVTMEEIDDKIKVIIHFKHVLNVKEMTHGQCFLKKKRQRSIILKNITQFFEPNQPIGNGDSATLRES